MDLVTVTVVGIAAATVLGAVLGDRMGMQHGWWSKLMQAAGILMLGVIIFGVLQALWRGERGGTLIVILVALICLAEVLGNWLERIGLSGSTKRLRSLLVVAVIAVHHFPEGVAAGLSCVSEGTAAAAVCGAVVLQTIPETMVILPTMQSAGFGKKWSYPIAAVSGAMEILGVLVGLWL